jgi:hypothetical protein
LDNPGTLSMSPLLSPANQPRSARESSSTSRFAARLFLASSAFQKQQLALTKM